MDFNREQSSRGFSDFEGKSRWRGTRPCELSRVINFNLLECFKILLKHETLLLSVIPQLVDKNRYEMLSFALLEHGKIDGLSVEFLQDLIKETRNEDIIKLLNTKIELMTSKVKTKVEMKEEPVDG